MDEETAETTRPSREIALHRQGSIDRILAGGGERRQSLRGFDDRYVDIVDYIIRCTHAIWDELGVGNIYTHYGHNTVVHAGYDETYGRDAVVASTLQALAAFPDRTLYGDEVIWSGDDEAGFYTSHRLTIVGHNTGYSSYGPPTGRRVEWGVIALCFVRENRVLEEWLVRDEVAVIRQLGFDPNAIAVRYLQANPAEWARVVARGKVERGVGQALPPSLPEGWTERPGDGFDVEAFVRRSYHDVWNRRLLNTVRETHAENHQLRASGGRRLDGRLDYAAFVLAMLAAFPDGKITVDHLDWMGNERDGYRVATRWTFAGTHRGPGEWGEPTGAQVRVLGLSHHRVEGGRFVAEWTLSDEFGLLKQLWAARLSREGDNPGAAAPEPPAPRRGSTAKSAPRRRRGGPVAAIGERGQERGGRPAGDRGAPARRGRPLRG